MHNIADMFIFISGDTFVLLLISKHENKDETQTYEQGNAQFSNGGRNPGVDLLRCCQCIHIQVRAPTSGYRGRC